jgi:prophage antirepressor-like protein
MEQDDPTMADQPCKDLQPLDVFSTEVLKNAEDALALYNPIFSRIRIYGTVEYPVFVAKDVQETLELKNLHYKGEDRFEWEEDKIKISIQTRGGSQSVVAFTEHGLYHAIWLSKTPAAKQFQRFMTCIMRRLRMTGVVTMDQAVADLKVENERLEKRLKALDMQMDIEHKTLIHYQFESEKLNMRHQDDSLALWKAKQAVEHARDPDVYALKDRLERLMRRTGRAIHIMLSEPPKEYGEEGTADHTYVIENYSEGDEDIIDPDEPMIWSIGFQSLKSKVAIKRAYVHKTVKLEDVHDALKTYRLEKRDKKGNTVGHYQNMYEITLEQIDGVIDEINRQDEQSQRAD